MKATPNMVPPRRQAYLGCAGAFQDVPTGLIGLMGFGYAGLCVRLSVVTLLMTGECCGCVFIAATGKPKHRRSCEPYEGTASTLPFHQKWLPTLQNNLCKQAAPHPALWSQTKSSESGPPSQVSRTRSESSCWDTAMNYS